MTGQDSFESVPPTSLSALPSDLLLGVIAEPFLGWKETCNLSMTNSRLWNFFCDFRKETLCSTKDVDNGDDINTVYIKAFLARLRFVTDVPTRRRQGEIGEVFRQVAILEKIVATMPGPAREAIQQYIPALSCRDVFGKGTIADHVITCFSAFKVNYEQ